MLQLKTVLEACDAFNCAWWSWMSIMALIGHYVMHAALGCSDIALHEISSCAVEPDLCCIMGCYIPWLHRVSIMAPPIIRQIPSCRWQHICSMSAWVRQPALKCPWAMANTSSFLSDLASWILYWWRVAGAEHAWPVLHTWMHALPAPPGSTCSVSGCARTTAASGHRYKLCGPKVCV